MKYGLGGISMTLVFCALTSLEIILCSKTNVYVFLWFGIIRVK